MQRTWQSTRHVSSDPNTPCACVVVDVGGPGRPRWARCTAAVGGCCSCSMVCVSSPHVRRPCTPSSPTCTRCQVAESKPPQLCDAHAGRLLWRMAERAGSGELGAHVTAACSHAVGYRCHCRMEPGSEIREHILIWIVRPGREALHALRAKTFGAQSQIFSSAVQIHWLAGASQDFKFQTSNIY